MDQISLLNLLVQTPPFATVPKRELQSLSDNLDVIRLNSGEAYYFEHGAQSGYILPLSGFLVLQKEHADHPCPVGIRLPIGGLWPVTDINQPTVSLYVEAISKSLLGFLSGSNFKRLDKAPALLHLALVSSSAMGLEMVTKQYFQRIRVPLAAQVAQLLLELWETTNEKSIVPYTHWQLSRLLSTHRETVSSLLGEFRREGWVETGVGWIKLYDIPALTKLANFY